MQYLILILLFLTSFQLPAMPVDDKLPRRSLGLGLSSSYVQLADTDRAQRFRLDFLALETLHPLLRWENHFAWAPDRRDYPSALEIRDNIYQWSTGLRVNYPYLFRYGFSLGPMLRLEQTQLKVKTESPTERSNIRWTLGWKAAASLDYAINQDWELSFFLAYEARPIAAKADVSFGAVLLRNTGEPR